MLSREQLQRAAANSGFRLESYEKAHVLVRLLEAVRTHPFLGSRVALKGGTALNLFVLDFPRLSVDIDLNYVGWSTSRYPDITRPQMAPRGAWAAHSSRSSGSATDARPVVEANSPRQERPCPAPQEIWPSARNEPAPMHSQSFPTRRRRPVTSKDTVRRRDAAVLCEERAPWATRPQSAVTPVARRFRV